MKGWGKMTNCPNCGAPITKETCEYCGTVFVDPYKEKKIQLEQEILRVKNDILLSTLNSGIIGPNTWKFFADDKCYMELTY